ncbi:MAG: class I SAM-dependent methyltransferase [Elainellaceae cyanobacterium]
MANSLDPTQRFSTRVENYVKYRPTYPPAVLTTLEAYCQLTPDSPIADVGSGTGILTQLFLDHGNPVYAVEPNAPMRQAAESRLAHRPNFYSVDGRAEATALPDASVDFVTAGQAFHWFDREAARREFCRILRPEGYVMLVWNDRCSDTPFLADYEQLLQRYGIGYTEVFRRFFERDNLAQFYGSNRFTLATLNHSQIFDYEGLSGVMLSSSYTPEADHPDYQSMLDNLANIFEAHSVNGQVAIEYTTRMYYGQLT